MNTLKKKANFCFIRVKYKVQDVLIYCCKVLHSENCTDAIRNHDGYRRPTDNSTNLWSKRLRSKYHKKTAFYLLQINNQIARKMASYIRTSSIEQFTNPDLEKYQQMDLLFSLEEPDFIPIMEPGSPESVVSEAQSSVSSTVMEDLDSIFDEVISTASPPSSPPAAQHHNGSTFFHETNPTFDDIQPTLQQVYQDVNEPQEEIVAKVEAYEERYVSNDFFMADESEATIVKVADSPVEKPRRGRARAPAAERAARKRNSNKESSRRYRQKIKSQQNDLLSSLDQLSKKKRAIEMDLAKTKAVNSFLVDQLREKFGPLMSRY